MFRKMLVYLLLAYPITQHKLPLLRTHGLLRRLSHFLTLQYRRRDQGRQRGSRQPGYNFDEGNTRFVCRSHRPWSEFDEGNPRSQRRSPQPRHKFGYGVPVSNAAPLNHVKGACASRAVPSSHASRINEDVWTARHPPKRTCSPSLLSDHVVAIGLRCGKANSKNTSSRP